MTQTPLPPKLQDDLPIQQDMHDDDFEGLTFEVVEEEQTAHGKVKHRGIYLIPNLITTAALLCGFYSITASSNQHFQQAIYALILAALFDGIDGRVARAMGAQSPFGEQYDSLSDMLAFGVAPAMLMYNWGAYHFGRIGLACCFIYTACAAFRLARFNVQIGSVDKRYFIGVASPLAAMLVVSSIWVQLDFMTRVESSQFTLITLNVITMVVVGLLMISNLKYYSFKVMDKKRVPFVIMIPVILILSAITYNIPFGMLIIGVTYCLSGIFTTLAYRKNNPYPANNRA